MRQFLLAVALFVCASGLASEVVKNEDVKKKHHGKHHHGKHHHHDGKHHHHHHHKHHKADGEHEAAKVEASHKKDKEAASFNPAPADKKPVQASKDAKKAGAVSHFAAKVAKKEDAKAAATSEDAIVKKMKALEEKLEKKKAPKDGQILVNGPLPVDFSQRFVQAVAQATGTDSKTVKVVKTKPGEGGIVTVIFNAPSHVVDSVEQEAADPDSKLANGNLHSFLVSRGDDEEEEEEDVKEQPKAKAKAAKRATRGDVEATPVEEKGIDIDTAMPYGDLEPFGREDTAQELTEDSIKESNSMVDQLERAEVAEEKRAVFRSLTRLRGAAITSFDGVARSQTGNIDEYNKIHQWRTTHPLHHLADEESDISKWAFPDNADF